MKKGQAMKKIIILILGILTGISLVLLGYMLLMYRYMQEANIGYPVPEKTMEQREVNSPFSAPDWEGAAMRKEAKAKTSVSMAVVGDLNLAGFLDSYQAGGLSALMDDACSRELQQADIAIGNHEFAFSTRGEPMAEKQYVFREDPKYVSVLTDMGMDVVSLANNHALDYGTEAFLDTMDTLKNAEIAYVGAGTNDKEAKALKTVEKNGKTIGFLAASRVIPDTSWNAKEDRPGMFTAYDDAALRKEIAAAKESCDVVIVYLHWGTERVEQPEDYQRETGKRCIEAGADAVIGSHPHILQGFEFHQGKPIVYSLGNFLFARTTETVILKMVLGEDNQLELSLKPYERQGNQLVPHHDASALFAHLQSISFGTAIDENGVIKEAKANE